MYGECLSAKGFSNMGIKQAWGVEKVHFRRVIAYN
jgi:hypothetical protein